MRRLLAACVLGAVASFVLPSEPSYDPWAWIVWGREIASLDLSSKQGIWMMSFITPAGGYLGAPTPAVSRKRHSRNVF